MWKVAGSSGQLALGKKFAGRLFESVFHADGRVELLGVRVVLARQPVADADVSVARTNAKLAASKVKPRAA